MTDESAGAGASEHDAVNVGIPVDPVDHGIQLLGDLHAEQAVGAPIDGHDKDPSAVVDLERAYYFFVCHHLPLVCLRP